MKNRLLALSSNVFIQGGIFLTVSNFIIGFLNYLFNVLVGRALGPSGYGEMTALFSYLTILSVPVGVITTIIIQRIGSQGENGYQYATSLEQWLIQKLKKWWWLFILILFFIPFIPKLTNLSVLSSYMLIPFLLLALFAAFYDGALQGLHYFLWFSLITIFITLIKLLGGITIFFGIQQLWVVIIFILISAIAKVIASYLIFHKSKPILSESKAIMDKRLRDFFHNKQLWMTTFSILSLTLLSNVDIIYAKKFLSSHEAGIYSSWALFAKIILYIIGPILGLSYVFFSSKKNERQHNKAMIISILFLSIAGITGYFFYSLFASVLISALFGSKFLEVIPYLGLASIFGISYVAVVYMNNYFLAKNSTYALILTALLPIYLALLFTIASTINQIIHINVIFTMLVVISYFIAYFRSNIPSKRKYVL